MLRFTLTMTEASNDSLRQAVFSSPGLEGAAYLLCGLSSTESERRLLVRDVIPVSDEHYRVRERDRLSIISDSYVPVAKRAREQHECVLFAHSHPEGVPNFSAQDDREDPKLMEYFSRRAPEGLHGCVVLSGAESYMGRIWAGEHWEPLSRVRIQGRRFRFIDRNGDEEPLGRFFDRQVRAFGPDVQRLLKRLHVGVVGAGGTGSAVVEELCRIGVGQLTVFDGDALGDSNTSRVYGSAASDEEMNKAELQARHVEWIGVGTGVKDVPMPITEEATAKLLRDCDMVFGCTDKETPRGIFVRLSLRYLIPVIDMGVKIKASDGLVEGVFGRVTTLLPGEACLFCRSRITAVRIRAESLPLEQLEREVEEGYVDELETDQPAVITFTTAVAAQAVTEMLHRLTGFMGEATQSSEVLMYFHERMVRTNRVAASSDCQCMLRSKWGRGDSRSFLELSWPTEA